MYTKEHVMHAINTVKVLTELCPSYQGLKGHEDSFAEFLSRDEEAYNTYKFLLNAKQSTSKGEKKYSANDISDKLSELASKGSDVSKSLRAAGLPGSMVDTMSYITIVANRLMDDFGNKIMSCTSEKIKDKEGKLKQISFDFMATKISEDDYFNLLTAVAGDEFTSEWNRIYKIQPAQVSAPEVTTKTAKPGAEKPEDEPEQTITASIDDLITVDSVSTTAMNADEVKDFLERPENENALYIISQVIRPTCKVINPTQE